MKLRALELEQFRKFRRPVRLDGFTDGINVLCGPNEFGKSTLLEAIRGLLFERFDSKAKPVESMRSWGGDAAPRLAMEFETGGKAYRIEKQFLQRPYARLITASGQFEAAAAEEELQRLLGFGAPGRPGIKPEHMGVWAALWVAQGHSFDQADLKVPSIRTTLADCLNGEVGVLTGAEKGRAVTDAARGALAAIQDGNGKPKGRAKEQAARAAELGGTLAALEERSHRLNSDVEGLSQLELRRAKLADPAVAAAEQDELAGLGHRRDAALVFQQRLDAAKAALDLAARGVADAEGELAARAARTKDLAGLADAVRAAEARLATAEQARTEHQGLVQAANAAVREAAVQMAAATRQAAQVKAALHLHGLVQEAAALRERTAQAEGAETNARTLSAQAAALRIDPAMIAAIQRAEQARDRVAAQLSARATLVTFDLLPGGPARVDLNGMALPGRSHTAELVAEGVIAIAGIGTIRVRPSASDPAALQTAETSVQAALGAAGAASLQAAEARLSECHRLEGEAGAAATELARLAPGDARTRLPPGLSALRDYLARVEAEIVQTQPAGAIETLAAAAQQAAEQAVSDAAVAHTAAVTAESASTAALTEARVALATEEGRVMTARTAMTQLAAMDRAAAEREPDAALAERLAAAGRGHAGRYTDLDAIERSRPQDSAATLTARIERLRKAAEQRHATLISLGRQEGELRGRVAAEGGAGLDEQIALITRERDEAAAESSALLREARVLKLLLDTLGEAERGARQAYLAPVVTRVLPYLDMLFPGAQVACDDDLQIRSVTRATEEEFGALSDGTREQIAVLARLAFADLLKDRGKPAMVILDDALAFSDPERMERMFDILGQAAARSQILILSCREDLFGRTGGNKLFLTSQG